MPHVLIDTSVGRPGHPIFIWMPARTQNILKYRIKARIPDWHKDCILDFSTNQQKKGVSHDLKKDRKSLEWPDQQ
jgi:hypothetical protein